MTIFATQPKDMNSKFARDAWIRALQRTASIDRGGVTLPVLIMLFSRRRPQRAAEGALPAPAE